MRTELYGIGLREVCRFLAVGAASAALNTAIIVVLTELFGQPYLVSFAICFFLVNIFGFITNRSWTFRVKHSRWKWQFLRYFVLSFASLLLSMVISVVLVRQGIAYWIAVYASAALMAPVNFIAMRFASFGVSKRPAGALFQ
ncbi:GtrA family protein [Sphingobium fuliginis]|uniref:GtrA family protein n=1 Tax=Sphingobium fuliginis (strain ATCC 27551) TaxID=336203 RepID=A0A7M2GDA3_SPHSA|nr:GtrA family protein [Sphingobium fuliginis]QOT70686.1 GtrA family protein [Sphingobium fuliginis]